MKRILLLLLCLLPALAEAASCTLPSDWLGSGWSYRKQLTMQKVSGNFINFPMLVSVTDADLAANARSDGADIRFTDADGKTLLYYEIEDYQSSTGTLVAWVMVPSAKNGNTFYLYYGNAGASSAANPAALWAQGGYKAVWHLNETGTTSSTSFRDSALSNHGTGGDGWSSQLPARVSGLAAGGQYFDTHDVIAVNSTSGLPTLNYQNNSNTMILSAWVKRPSAGFNPSVYNALISAFQPSNRLDQLAFNPGSSSYLGCAVGQYCLNNYAGNPVAQGGTVATDSAWHHVAYTRDANKNLLFIDGKQVANTSTNLDSGSMSRVYLGALNGGTTFSWPSEALRGYLDEARIGVIDNQSLSNRITTEYDNMIDPAAFNSASAQQAGCAGLDHFVITVAASASTCTPHSVTVGAYDSGNNLLSDYTGTILLSTSTGHGNWAKSSASGTLNPASDSDDNGSVSYTFVSGDGGDAVFTLSNEHADDLTITANDTSAAIGTTSATVNFRDNAFVLTPQYPGGTTNTDVVAGRGHVVNIALWRRDTSTNPAVDCAIATGYTGSKNVKLWRTTGAQNPVAAVAPTSGACTIPTALPGSNNCSISFASGQANIVLASSDVGQFTVNVRDDSSGFALPASRIIDGSSATLVVRPFGFALDSNDDRANNGSAGPSYAADANGSAFTSAGTGFPLTVSARQWQAADDSNDDGQPDTGANLYDNGLTAHFGQEPTPVTVTLGHALVAPSGGAVGNLGTTSVGGFSGGSATVSSQTYDEVGIINVSASHASYLGGGNIAGTLSNLGRFTPHHFRLGSPGLTPACVSASGKLSYMGQPFTGTFQLTAENTGNATTTNYQSSNSFAKLAWAGLNFRAIDNNAVSGVFTPLSSRLSAPTASLTFVNGTTTKADGTPGPVSASLSLPRDSAGPDGPYDYVNTGLIPVDSDGVTLLGPLTLDSDHNGSGDSFQLDAAGTYQAIRYGRLRLGTNTGSELLALSLPLTAEYFIKGTTDRFATNALDSCTTLTLAPAGPPTWGNVTLGSYTNSLASGETAPTGSVTLSSGTGTLTLSAPGAGNQGSVLVTVNAPAWLDHNWNAATAGDENPSARATFGLFRGRRPLIYWRETYR